MIGLMLAIAALSQDPITAEAKFRAVLERVERAGLAVPDLTAGATELDVLAGGLKDLSKDLRYRLEVVRAQAAVLRSLHSILLKNKGLLFDVPLAAGKPVSVTIVDVLPRSVKISRPEANQEIAYSDLDPEWVLTTARAGSFGGPEATFMGGLWLAKAARWDVAFLSFAEADTDHPLALEARKRGLEAAIPGFDALVRGKRWTDALARWDALNKLAPGDGRLVTARARLLDAMVEHGKDLCRKKSKGAMNELIDLIAKQFPDGASRIEDIREAVRWIKVTDPKKFGVESVKGPPWLLQPKDGKEGYTAWLEESPEKYEGIAAFVRIPKGEETMGGLSWDDRRHIVSISDKQSSVGVYVGNKGESLPNVVFKKIAMEGRHHLSVRLRAGQYVVQYNGEEIYRAEGKSDGFEVLGLNAHKGKAWFDEVWLLKKE